MGGIFSNPIKSSLRDCVKDEQFMKPVRRQGVIWVKEVAEDKEIRVAGADLASEVLSREDLRKNGVVCVREIVKNNEIRVAGADFVSEVLAREDVIKQSAMVLIGVESKIHRASIGIDCIAVAIGFGVLVYAVNSILGRTHPPPPPAAAEAAASAAAAAASASAATAASLEAREAAATAAFYTAALHLPERRPED